MKSARRDRYATNQNAIELVKWLKQRQDYVITSLSITDTDEFSEWLDKLLLESKRRGSAETIQQSVHERLPGFIGNERAWPRVKSAFRSHQFQSQNKRLSLHRDDAAALHKAQRLMGTETLGETIFLMVEGAEVMATNHKAIGAFNALSKKTVSNNIGRIILALHGDGEMPKSAAKALKPEFRYHLKKATSALYSTLFDIQNNEMIANQFAEEHQIPADSVRQGNYIKDLKLQLPSVYLNGERIAILIKDFDPHGVISFQFAPTYNLLDLIE